MCSKVSHKTTWGAAQQIAALQKAGKVKKGKKLGGYWCEECQGYHISADDRKLLIFKQK